MDEFSTPDINHTNRTKPFTLILDTVIGVIT